MNTSLFEKFAHFNREDLSEALIDAVKGHRMDEVKYLLTSPELEEHADININLDAPLRNAARSGFFDIVKYLLTSPDLEKHSNILAETNYPFKTACRHGYLEIVKFFIDAPELSNKIDIHIDDDIGFRTAMYYKQPEIIQYFIFDKNIEETDNIKERIAEFLDNNDSSVKEFGVKVNNMFRLRDLNKQLHDELPVTKTNNKKVKL